MSKLCASKVINHSFFNSATINNSYWAGYIAADGHLSKDNSIFLECEIKDNNLLKWFLHDLGLDEDNLSLDNYLTHRARKYNDKICYSSRLTVHSEPMVTALTTVFNIPTGAKSKLLSPPKLDKENSLAFIKGYLDGDGSIFLHHEKKYISVKFVGTHDILSWIKSFTTSSATLEKTISPAIYKFCLTHKQAREFIQELLAIETPELERKWMHIYYDKNYKLSPPHIYLAGPCELHDSWRNSTEIALNSVGFHALNPLKNESFKKVDSNLIVSDTHSAFDIVKRDMHLLGKTKVSGGVILMNLTIEDDNSNFPVGTLFELQWAHQNGVPIVVIINEKTPKKLANHPWVMNHSTKIFSKVEEAIEYLKNISV